MIIRPTDSYEAKKFKLAQIAPSRHFAILDSLSRGETVDISTAQEIKNDPLTPALTELLKNRTIDLTKHAELYYAVNRKLVNIRHMLKRKEYEPYRKHAATIRKLNSESNGFSDGKSLRHVGALPPDVYQTIIAQYPNVDERGLVVQWLLKTEEGKAYATVEKGI